MTGLLVLTAFVAQLGSPAVAPDFDTHIVPALTRAGCNSGACHGAAAGRGGLRLSLFGAVPADDYAALVLAGEGRRIQRTDPRRSLLLRKPLEELPHGGGSVLVEDSATIELLRNWIAAGALRGSSRQLLRFEIAPASPTEASPTEASPTEASPTEASPTEASPTEASPTEASLTEASLTEASPTEASLIEASLIEASPQSPVALRATAHFSDGVAEDVSAWTLLLSDDPAAVEILDGSLSLVAHRPGQHTVIARFRNHVQPVSVLVPFDAQTSQPWPPAAADRRAAAVPGTWIDEAIQRQLTRLQLSAAPPADDAAWLRRVTLDLAGRLPTPEELDRFLLDPSVDKRRTTAQALLDSEDFDRFWSLRLTRWWQLQSFPQEPEATAAYTDWIHQAMRERSSYRRLVEQLLTAEGDSHHIGPANFARTAGDARQYAELVSRVFMGSRLQCANCHDHPLDAWTQDDYHGLAAVFAGLETGRLVAWRGRGSITHPRTGAEAVPKLPGARFLEPSAAAPQEFVNWLLAPDHPLFARATVNRIWEALLGRGLVDPVDDLRITNPPSHPALLDQLAADFVRHGMDIRHTIAVIIHSDVYGRAPRPASASGELDRWYVYALPKSLEPEVLLDAIDEVLATRTATPLRYSTGLSAEFAPATLAELEVLGRCKPGGPCEPARSGEPGLAAKLHWLNGPLLNQRLRQPDNRLLRMLRDGAADEAIIQDLTRRSLGQPAAAERIQTWLEELAGQPGPDRQAWLEDFAWALLSSPDFYSNR
jgi:hypothetical protein